MILCWFFLLQKLLYITIILHETLTFIINKIKTKIFLENRDFVLNGIYKKSIIVQEDNGVISIKSEHLNFSSRIFFYINNIYRKFINHYFSQ